MRVIKKRTLVDFWEEYPDSESQLRAWYSEAKSAVWNNSADVKALYRSASILKKGRVVFNICGNKYRLVVKINYRVHIIYIRFIGTHTEYDKINAEEV